MSKTLTFRLVMVARGWFLCHGSIATVGRFEAAAGGPTTRKWLCGCTSTEQLVVSLLASHPFATAECWGGLSLRAPLCGTWLSI